MSAMRSMPPDAASMQLQQEALARVRQMQQHTRAAIQHSEGFSAPGFARMQEMPQHTPAFAPAPVTAPQGTPAQSAPLPAASPPPGQPATEVSTPSFSFQPNQTGTKSGGSQQRHPNNRPPQGESILSQLFGGGRSQGGTRQGGHGQQPSSPSATSTEGTPGHSPSGLLDLIRGGLSGSATAGLGDSLRGSIASASKPLSDLLDAFSIDGEKLMILLVMWVIFNERSDNKTLLLALGYLLL